MLLPVDTPTDSEDSSDSCGYVVVVVDEKREKVVGLHKSLDAARAHAQGYWPGKMDCVVHVRKR